MRMRIRRIVAGVVLLGLGAASPGRVPARADEVPSLRVRRDQSLNQYGIESRDVSVAQIADALARASGCVVEVDEDLRSRRLTADLGLRAPERLFAALARRVDARVTVRYRLASAPAATRRRGSLAMASAPTPLYLAAPVELREALRRLPVAVDVEGELRGAVRVASADLPLARVLDQIARQVGATWKAVVFLETRRPLDAEAAAAERMRAHFGDLFHLSPSERREELAADLESLEALPSAERTHRLSRMAADILSMATLLHETPGEHRGPILTGIQAIREGYQAALSRLSPPLRTEAEPVHRALRELDQRLAQIR
jgi:hypothetical protein